MDNMTAYRHAEFMEQTTAHSGRGHPRGGLAGGRAFEDVTGVFAIVFQNASEIRMTRARTSYRAAAEGRGIVGAGSGVHHILPVRPVAIADQHRDRRAEGLPGTHA